MSREQYTIISEDIGDRTIKRCSFRGCRLQSPKEKKIKNAEGDVLYNYCPNKNNSTPIYAKQVQFKADFFDVKFKADDL